VIGPSQPIRLLRSLKRHHVAALQVVQVIGVPLHHVAALLDVLGFVVDACYTIFNVG
jgi:hypothetical protein